MSKKSSYSTKHPEQSIREPIEAKSYNQSRLIDSLKQPVDDETGSDAYVYVVGSAGTGKTHITATLAADLYLQHVYSKIILVTPTVPCGEDPGALPGTAEDKFAPWASNLERKISERLGPNKFKCDKGKNIIYEPLVFMRGKTFDNSFIIVDEAQNLTMDQVVMVSTRNGIGSKMVFIGDVSQQDLRVNYKTSKRMYSGLDYLVEETLRQNIDGIDIIRFTEEDTKVARGKAAAKMVAMHNRRDPKWDIIQ